MNTSVPADGPMNIEDYGLIGDCKSAALVSRQGSIDWLCWPRFDSAACFAALLGTSECGRWLIATPDSCAKSTRRYRGETMILETKFETPDGVFAVIDFMPVEQPHSSVIRIVEGLSGLARVEMQLTLRFDYGASVPWVTRLPKGDGIVAIAGPNLVALRSAVPLRGEDLSTTAEFDIRAGQRVAFVLSYGLSHRAPPPPIDADDALRRTQEFWQDWASRCSYKGPHRDAVIRSLLILKAQTYAATGGIVAAPTTSLPEKLGGERNWDYRFCWLRDATLTLVALMGAGYYEEAGAWRDWLRRAVAGAPEDFRILYGVGGERLQIEWEIPWLPGYQGASPVRVGNAAANQLQLDVFGELMDVLHLGRAGGLKTQPTDWSLQCRALTHLEKIWREADDGIWEVRGGRRQFTFSKVMAWVAFDRSIRDVERIGLDAPVDDWRKTRDEIHRTVCEKGYDAKRGVFTQSFGGSELDASLLLIPDVGFLPIDDVRVQRTIEAIEGDLIVDGFVKRYHTESGTDGLPKGEGVFLACSFWLADVYLKQGRMAEAEKMLYRLLALRNDLGLLSEEYDTKEARQVGNFPQAFSHLALVHTVLSLDAQASLREQMDPQIAQGPTSARADA
jgi:GH15 family glucan-1,4-alpha-glucosidase